jgi:hypothetical protein
VPKAAGNVIEDLPVDGSGVFADCPRIKVGERSAPCLPRAVSEAPNGMRNGFDASDDTLLQAEQHLRHHTVGQPPKTDLAQNGGTTVCPAPVLLVPFLESPLFQ